MAAEMTVILKDSYKISLTVTLLSAKLTYYSIPYLDHIKHISWINTLLLSKSNILLYALISRPLQNGKQITTLKLTYHRISF